MAGIKGKNTRPEMLVRRGLHGLGLRYRLHDKRLPGKPDIVLPKWKAVILVHGCFWHGHDCPLFKWPSTRQRFWHTKITRNREKDAETLTALGADGWRVLVIWECALKGRGKQPAEHVIEKVVGWLKSGQCYGTIRGGIHAGD